jgi:erythromycin esterase-like protein
MWRNADVLDFVGWLRAFNERSPRAVGFYGLDLYSLHASMQAVLAYLDRVDADAARRARTRYACFETLGATPQAYGYASGLDLSRSCEDEVVAQLVELQARRHRILMHDGGAAEDEAFAAEQNALVVQNAERYYRGMFGGRVSTWNLRDTHMMDTLDALAAHLDRRATDERAKIVVWAHNSHVGDARATEAALRGELDLGQLARERHGAGVANVGFTTWAGTVSAASEWDAPVERKRVRPALDDSYEALFHAVGAERFLVDLREVGEAGGMLATPRLERAIGVVYQPATERWSHYFECSLPTQFDFVVHVDETRAVEPLERSAGWDAGELPETYPQGL